MGQEETKAKQVGDSSIVNKGEYSRLTYHRLLQELVALWVIQVEQGKGR